ncbi:MAG TPA: aspartyl/asparaginyl beta-hydroxylase domain-containing protein [Vicinamibacteria bacterium]|nr:aspartyl/asparaginyl beta-hydroxylase domain-containing protein [Vicinamibacteria bacterium]
MTTFFWVTGVVAWLAAAAGLALALAAFVLRRPRVRRWFERPARYPYAYATGYRLFGLELAVARKLGINRVVPAEVDHAFRSVRLPHMTALRDALLEVDRLPIVAKGKAALGLPSVFEIPTRGVPRIPSPYTHPLQYPPYYVPGVPARMFYDPSEFEWVKPLEEAFPAIREELLNVLREDGTGFQAYMSEGNVRLAGWNTFNFFFYGKKFEENCARCPQTTRVLESLPRFERDHVMFSALNPRSHIPPHTGPMNGIIRGHLALVARPGSYIRVGSEQRTWEEGKVLVFDDSFEHEVWNHSDHVRIVLFMNFWHPCFSPGEIAALERLRTAYEMSPLSRVHAENQGQRRGHDLAMPG